MKDFAENGMTGAVRLKLDSNQGRGNARKKVSKFISKDIMNMNVGIVGIDKLVSAGVGLHPLKR